MANEQHSAQTDPDLHEPKGVSTANANEVYVSDGAGSGNWTSTLSVGGTQVHGEMTMQANATATTIAASGTWYQVTAGWITGHADGVTFNTDHLEIVTAGHYVMTANLSFLPVGATNKIWRFAIAIDTGSGYVFHPPYFTIETTSASVHSIAIPGLLELGLTAGDKIGILVQNETNTDNLTVQHGILSLTLRHAD